MQLEKRVKELERVLKARNVGVHVILISTNNLRVLVLTRRFTPSAYARILQTVSGRVRDDARNAGATERNHTGFFLPNPASELEFLCLPY